MMKLIKLTMVIGIILTEVIFVLMRHPVLAENLQLLSGEFTDIGAALTGGIEAAVAWGDYDKDGDLDVLISGFTHNGRISEVYRNNDGIFTDIDAGLVGVSQGSVDWGDYDNDNDLDILLTGETLNDRIAKIYRNDIGVFTDINALLPGSSDGTSRWGDYDMDGDLDIVFTGEAPNYSALIFRNENGNFIDIGASLVGTHASYSAWGDYDQDGDLDLAISGSSSNIYRNDHGKFIDLEMDLPQNLYGSVDWGDCDNDGDLDLLFNSFTGQFPPPLWIYEYTNGNFVLHYGPMGTSNGTATWGDYDNDGDLDILIMGGNTVLLNVYKNNGFFDFSDISAGLTPVWNGAAMWGDYNNDGRLDFLVSGETDYSARVAKIYQNNTILANTSPTSPGELTSTPASFSVKLSWKAASDSQTPINGLTYSIRIGTTPGGSDFLAPMSDLETGYRFIPHMGNVGHTTSIRIFGLAHSTQYFWSVQTIDSAFSGSAFAQESSFITTSPLFMPMVWK